MNASNQQIKDIITKELVRNARVAFSQEARQATAQALNRILAEIDRRENEEADKEYADYVQRACEMDQAVQNNWRATV